MSDHELDAAAEKIEAPEPAKRGCVAPILALIFLATTCAAGWYAYRVDEQRKKMSASYEQVAPEHARAEKLDADLAKDGVAAIREMAGILRQFPDRRFMVAGHTDNIPGGGKFKTNWDLSTARAVIVTEQLALGGMNAAKLVAAGYSQYEPIASNGTEAGRAENRRIEIVLLPNIQEMPPMPEAKNE